VTAILSTLLEITIYSVILFGAIALFRLLMKKRLSPAMHYMAWFLLIARLLMPVTVASGFSLFVIPAEKGAAAQAQEVDLSALLGDADREPEPALPAEPEAAELRSGEQNSFQAQQTNTSAAAADSQAKARRWDWNTALTALWLGGAFLVLLHTAVSAARLKMRLNADAVPAPREWQLTADKIRAELGVRARTRFVVMKDFVSPALSASLKPTVVMPERMLSRDDAQVEFALRHELTHLKRGDHIVCLLLMLLKAAYWFNPVVWLAASRMKMDMETACDSMVVRSMDGAGRKRYASTIIDMYARGEARFVLGMALGNTKQTAERRIRGIFMRRRSSRPARLTALLFSAVMLVACFTTACQPTPEQPIVIGKDQDAMLSAAVRTPGSSGSGEAAFSLSGMEVPETYTFDTTGADGKLTVSADAAVRVPDVDALPTVKVGPGTFTQETVSGMLDYLYGDTPYYRYDNTVTKDDYERRILQYQRQMADGGIDEEGRAFYQEEIERLQEAMADAPEERKPPFLSDGTMTLDSKTGNFIIEVQSEDGRGRVIAHFSCYAATGTIQTTAPFGASRLDDSHLFYSNYSSEDDEYYNYTMEGAQQVYGDAEIPDDLKDKLGVTLAEAKAQVQGMLDAAGVDDMVCSAAFVIDDHGTGHVDDYSGVASDFAFKLFYTRSVNGAPVLPTTEFAQNSGEEYDYTWILETMQVIVTDGGIVDISWYSPCAVTGTITENTNIIGFDEAAAIFEKKVLTFYEARIEAYGLESIGIDVDNVELGLLRVKQQNAEGAAAGLYVPVWAFYGTVRMAYPDGYIGYDAGCDFHEPPYTVMAVNAIDGSIIDVQAGY